MDIYLPMLGVIRRVFVVAHNGPAPQFNPEFVISGSYWWPISWMDRVKFIRLSNDIGRTNTLPS